MADAKDLLDRQFLHMREHLLSLAADFDRIDSADAARLQGDPRLNALFEAAGLLRPSQPNRAESLQMLLSER